MRGEAATALARLDTADARREEFEAAVQAQASQTTRLTERLAPPRAKLKRLRDAQLVLRPELSGLRVHLPNLFHPRRLL